MRACECEGDLGGAELDLDSAVALRHVRVATPWVRVRVGVSVRVTVKLRPPGFASVRVRVSVSVTVRVSVSVRVRVSAWFGCPVGLLRLS